MIHFCKYYVYTELYSIIAVDCRVCSLNIFVLLFVYLRIVVIYIRKTNTYCNTYKMLWENYRRIGRHEGLTLEGINIYDCRYKEETINSIYS